MVGSTMEEAATDDLMEMLLLLGALRRGEVDSGMDLGDNKSSSFDVHVRDLCVRRHRQSARANFCFQAKTQGKGRGRECQEKPDLQLEVFVSGRKNSTYLDKQKFVSLLIRREVTSLQSLAMQNNQTASPCRQLR